MSKHKGFTLIEVMVAVMIISVVIMALLQMHANSTNLFSNIEEKLTKEDLSSFFVGNADYGFNKEKVDAYELVSEFSLDDDFRRQLKQNKLSIDYEQLDTPDDNNQTNSLNGIVLYMGKMDVKSKDETASFYRLTTRSIK
ncbi:prepilin-type N-terminal cleavage/methylation domain-containing protein [Sulfurimonas sp. HSL-1716]|uniref:type IV pilus modification PilV family protein n=1 Tax=Hydrocurvibacter sulfurireducens TaxID=3131937 RepID=UPI0031FA2FEA